MKNCVVATRQVLGREFHRPPYQRSARKTEPVAADVRASVAGHWLSKCGGRPGPCTPAPQAGHCKAGAGAGVPAFGGPASHRGGRTPITGETRPTEARLLPSRACRSLPYPGGIYVPINPWQVERKRHTLKVHVRAHAEYGLLTRDGLCRGWSTSHDTSTGVGLSEGCSVTRLTES